MICARVSCVHHQAAQDHRSPCERRLWRGGGRRQPGPEVGGRSVSSVGGAPCPVSGAGRLGQPHFSSRRTHVGAFAERPTLRRSGGKGASLAAAPGSVPASTHPRTTCVGRAGEWLPCNWSVYSWIVGEAATKMGIGEPCRFATALAGFLAALQRINASDGPPAGPHSFYRGGPLAAYDAETRRAIADVGGRIYGAGAIAVWNAAITAVWRGPPLGAWRHRRRQLAGGERASERRDRFRVLGGGRPGLRPGDCVDFPARRGSGGLPCGVATGRPHLGARSRLDIVEGSDRARCVPKRQSA